MREGLLFVIVVVVCIALPLVGHVSTGGYVALAEQKNLQYGSELQEGAELGLFPVSTSDPYGISLFKRVLSLAQGNERLSEAIHRAKAAHISVLVGYDWGDSPRGALIYGRASASEIIDFLSKRVA
jgi:hypothetical protein